MGASDWQKFRGAAASLFVGLLAVLGSLGFAGAYFESLSVSPQPSERSFVSEAFLLAAILSMPVVVDLLCIYHGRLRFWMTATLALASVAYVVVGCQHLWRLAPRIDQALLAGPGAWVIALPVGGVVAAYAFLVLLPVTGIGVHYRFRT